MNMAPLLAVNRVGRHTPQHCSVLSRGASATLQQLTNPLSKALLRKSPARSRLEILFERKSLLLIRECDVSLNDPRCLFRRVRDLTGVVLRQGGPQVARDADVVPIEMLQASEDVNLGHAGSAGLPSRSSRAAKPAFALRAPARQPSLASRAKAGGR